MDSANDSEIVDRCLRGVAQAFEPLVEKYQRVLFNVALRMLGNREDARDLTQTTFLKAYGGLETYDGKRKFFSWIYRILVNESINFRRRRKPDQGLPPELASADHPDAGVYSVELRERVRTALSKLSKEHREVVTLRHFAELSYGEIAQALSLPEKTVKSRLHTARQRLAELIDVPREAR
jgi:RNA polymerase sigma-70 factor (ECF subfamily)